MPFKFFGVDFSFPRSNVGMPSAAPAACLDAGASFQGKAPTPEPDVIPFKKDGLSALLMQIGA